MNLANVQMPDKYRPPTIVLMGPALRAVSGVSTHLGQLLGSSLVDSFNLLHFQIGSEGRGTEALPQKMWRFAKSPFSFGRFLLRHRVDVVHLNTSLEPKSYWRDILYLLIARVLDRKVLYQVHGGALPSEFFAGNGLLTGLLRWVLNLPDVVVLLAQVELRAYRSFVPDARLEVVANAIGAAPFACDPVAARTEGRLHHAIGVSSPAAADPFDCLVQPVALNDHLGRIPT